MTTINSKYININYLIKIIFIVFISSSTSFNFVNAVERITLVDSYKGHGSISGLIANGTVNGNYVPIKEKVAKQFQKDLNEFCTTEYYQEATGRIRTENGFLILKPINKKADYGFFLVHLMDGTADEIIFSTLGLINYNQDLVGIECK